MGIKLDSVRPWGRNLKEYCKMFNLEALPPKLLDLASGPAAFNAQVTDKGGKVTSLDPIYQLTKAEIEQSIAQTKEDIALSIRGSMGDFIWDQYASLDNLIATRLQAMAEFLKDYEQGKAQGRYLAGTVLDLPFSDQSFDLCLCSHFLFLYSEQLDLDFHQKAMAEITRVASETRIYPLVDLEGNRSKHLDEIMAGLKEEGLTVEIKPTEYRFQKGATEYLSITH